MSTFGHIFGVVTSTTTRPVLPPATFPDPFPRLVPDRGLLQVGVNGQQRGKEDNLSYREFNASKLLVTHHKHDVVLLDGARLRGAYLLVFEAVCPSTDVYAGRSRSDCNPPGPWTCKVPPICVARPQLRILLTCPAADSPLYTCEPRQHCRTG